jgi:hypothetical protein
VEEIYLLPAPLIVLTPAGIERLDATARSLAPVVRPTGGAAITQFDVSPADGSIVYRVEQGGAASLRRVASDGTGDTELLAGDASAPRVSPDGSQVAVRLAPTGESDTVALAGVFLVPTAGGAPQLLQADDPPPDPAQPALLAGLAFEPLAWSPDGTRLLLTTVLPGGDYCGMAVKELATGVLVAISPQGALVDCGRGTWSQDGTSIIMTLQDPGASAARLPGLWRADPATGAVTLFLPEISDGSPAIYAAAREVIGELRVFIALAPAGYDPLAYPPPLLEFAMARAAPDGLAPSERLRPDTHLLYEALWAPDGSGAVALVASGGEDPDGAALLWLPADGSPPVMLPITPAQPMQFAWGGSEV